jgi:hypothetical protein
MVLSIMLADSGGVFAEVPPALRRVAKLSIVKWGFEARRAQRPTPALTWHACGAECVLMMCAHVFVPILFFLFLALATSSGGDGE